MKNLWKIRLIGKVGLLYFYHTITRMTSKQLSVIKNFSYNEKTYALWITVFLWNIFQDLKDNFKDKKQIFFLLKNELEQAWWVGSRQTNSEINVIKKKQFITYFIYFNTTRQTQVDWHCLVSAAFGLTACNLNTYFSVYLCMPQPKRHQRRGTNIQKSTLDKNYVWRFSFYI